MPFIRTISSNVSQNSPSSFTGQGSFGTEPVLTGKDAGQPYGASYVEAENFQDTIGQYWSDGQLKSFKDFYDKSGLPLQPFNMADVANSIGAQNTSGRGPAKQKPAWTANTAQVNPAGNYSQAQTQQIVDLINDGKATVQEVAEHYGVDPAIIQQNLDYINRTHHVPQDAVGGADGNDTIDMSSRGKGDDAVDPNVIIDDAARDGTTIDDLIGTYKDPDGNPYSIASVIGALILSNNPNAATVLSNSGYNPDGSAAGTPDPGPGTDPGPGADPGTGPGSSQPPAADPPAADPPAADPPAADPPAADPPVSDIPDDDKPEGGIGLPSLPELATGAATAAGIGGAMSGFSNLFSNTTSEAQKMDPDIKNRLIDLFGPSPGIQNDLVNRLNTSYQKYGKDRYADPNQDQLNFEQMVRNNIARAPGADTFDEAVSAAKNLPSNRVDPITGKIVGQQAFGGAGTTDLQTAARENIQDVVAGQFKDTNLDPYQNPYTDQVINRALSDLDRASDMRMQAADSRATGAGAFGSDRASIERGMIDQESIRQAGTMVANLRARGFEDAADRVEADIDRQMKADESNQFADAATTQDSMRIAADLAQTNQREKRIARTDEAMNQLRRSQALLDAFGQGSDQYRNYLADFMGMGDRIDARSQREKDFDFAEFAASIGYDQSMIQNMINLLNTAQGDVERKTETEMGAMGQLEALSGAWPALSGMTGTGWDILSDILNPRSKSARDEYIEGVGKP